MKWDEWAGKPSNTPNGPDLPLVNIYCSLCANKEY